MKFIKALSTTVVLSFAGCSAAPAFAAETKQPTPYCVELVETAAVFHKELKEGRTTVSVLKNSIDQYVAKDDADTRAALNVLVNYTDAYRSKTTAYVKKEVMLSCMKFQ